MKRPKGRANGEGSIYRDGATWIAQISIKGLLVRRRCKTEADALVKLDELREKRKKRLNLTDKAPTYAAWFEVWLTTNRRLKETTREDYREWAQRHTLPVIGRYLLPEITNELLQDFVNALDDKGLSTNSITNVLARVRTALARAVRAHLIPSNPAIGLDIPRGKRKRMPIALTEDETMALLDVLKDHRMYALYVLAVTLGLRQGELVGLRWSDVSWKNKTLSIRQTIRRKGTRIRRNTTKTESSERVLDLADETIGDDLIVVLRHHWELQEQERLIHDKAQAALPEAQRTPWNPERLVFVNERGTLYAVNSLRNHLNRTKIRASLPDALVFHDLRHTAGSLMLARGADILDVSKILGHKSPDITLRVYAHSYKNKRRQTIASLSAALLRRGA